MDIVEGITTSLKREREPDRVYSFLQGIMPRFVEAFDEKYGEGDLLTEDDIVILPGKDIVIHKKLGFDSSWYGTPAPPVHWGEKRDILMAKLEAEWNQKNPNYHVSGEGGLYNHGTLMGYPYNFQVDGLLKTRELWEEWHEDYHVDDIPDHHVDELNAALEMGIEHDFLIIPSSGLLMEPLIGRIGIDSIGRFAHRDPDLLHEICETIMQVPLKKFEFLAKTDAPVLIIPDDCAYKGRPIMSPRMYRKFIIPHFEKMIKIAHGRGKLVIFHSDGVVEPYYEDLIKIGLDAHQSLEPAAGNDLKMLKEKYGKRLSFIGNIDCSRLLPYGNREEVVEATKDCLRWGAPGGGYMFSPCTDLTDSCKLENVEAMMETYKKYRTYPISIP